MFYLLLLLAVLSGTLVLSITANDELQCQSGWHKYNDKCFWYSDFKLTRNNATLECKSFESTLVTIDSSTTTTFLEQNITGDTSYWIGLKMDNIATSAWRWNTGGPLVSRSTDLYWCNNRTGADTACAVINYAQEPCIKSDICTLKRPFICVKETNTGTCQANWDAFSDGTPRCYYFSTQKKTSMEAARNCWDNGGRLIVIPNYVTKQYLKENRLATDTVHWIGFSPYHWDDDTPYNWNNWDENGPHIGETCTRLLSNTTWKYGDCSTALHHFICQKAASPFTTTIPTTELSTASSTATTQEVIEDTTTSASSSSAFSTIISSTTSISTRTFSTSSITRIARIPTTYTPETISSTHNVIRMSTTNIAPDITTNKDTENTALGNAETTTTIHNENDVPIILYVLIGIYTAVGMTAVVFIGLLAKYISLRRRYEKLIDETPNETEIDDIYLDDNNDNKLYENQEYVSVDPHESITSGKATVPQNVETDNVVYSDIDVDSRKPKDGNHIETKETSGHTDTHQVIQVPVKQNSHTLSNGEHDVVKADDEHSEQGETSHLYYNDPDCMASVTNSEQVNIYDDPINVIISESDDKDV